MSTYLKYYALERSPFEDEATSKVVLGTKALRDALATIRTGLDEGASRICVNGGPGMGKTSLASALPKLLGDAARVAVILHPDADWDTHRGSIAKQWRVGVGGLARSTLLEAARTDPLILVIDEAEKTDAEFLDHLDVLLSYRSEDDKPVVQSVLLANLGLVRHGDEDQRSEPSPLVWWLDRIQTLDLEFAPLPRDGVDSYLQKHLKRAGWSGERLFSHDACHAIHAYAGGIPGEIGRLAEKLLVEASTLDLQLIEAEFVHEILDRENASEAKGVSDEFESLVSEEEFVGADVSDEAIPTSSDTAQSFCETVRAQIDETISRRDAIANEDADVDANGRAIAEFHDYLSAPPTDEELRALSGSRFGPMLRMAAVIAVAIGLGAIAITWLRPAPEPRESAGIIPNTVIEDVAEAAETSPPALAKLKGPIIESPPEAPNRGLTVEPLKLPEGNPQPGPAHPLP